ncbi:hypothetical protein ACLKA6_003066 [Drosophila palustris]
MEPSTNTTPIPTDADAAAVAALSVACLSDEDSMSIRKPFTLPKILDGKFYKNIQPNQKTPGAIQATCTSCYGLISGTTKSTGNFLSHIKRRHKELLPLCQLYCQAKSTVSANTSATSNDNKPATINTVHPTPSVMEQKPSVAQLPLPTSYATTTTHLAMPMPLAMPLSMPVTVQAPQMMALMQQHQRQQNSSHQLPQLQTLGQSHGAVYISKDY